MVFGLRAFCTAGLQPWNQLPADIHNIPTYWTFELDLKAFYL